MTRAIYSRNWNSGHAHGQLKLMPTILHYYPPPRVTIEDAIELFLDYQVTLAPGVTHCEYEKYLNMIKDRLNQYDRACLSASELAYLERHPDKTFCELFGPEWLLAEARKLVKETEAGRIQEGVRIRNLKGLVRRLALWLGRKENLKTKGTESM